MEEKQEKVKKVVESRDYESFTNKNIYLMKKYLQILKCKKKPKIYFVSLNRKKRIKSSKKEDVAYEKSTQNRMV